MKCAVKASYSEGSRIPNLTSSGHDYGPRDPKRGRKGCSERGLGCGDCEGLGVTAAVGVWGSFIRQHLHMRML